MLASSAPRKKLIEVSIPLEAINAASAREKSIRHGHPSTLHLWWARRPLAACRAVLFSQLVDDPSAWPDRFPTEEAQDAERRRLHRVIEAMVPWEASNDERILNAARWEIARSVAWGLGEEPPAQGDGKAILDYLQTKAPPVYDPFSGGGSIPLEAQRLGLRAYGSDLNPVAVLIGKALVEIPPKFAGLPPVNPKALAEMKRGGWHGKGAQGLAEDVRYYGQWMRDEAEKRIGHLYPKATLPDGSQATVIAWLWARTVRSPDPAAKGAMVPLVSSFMLSTKEGKKAWVEVVIDAAAPDGWRFEVKTGSLSKAEEERLKAGTKGEGRGSTFNCVLSGSAVRGDYIKAEGMAGRMSARLMAIVAEGNRSRIYVSPVAAHETTARQAETDDRVVEAREGGLNQPVPERLTGGTCYSYGLTSFDKLFTPRQLVALTTFSDLVSEAREKALADAQAAGLDRRAGTASPEAASPTPTTRLHEGGLGAEAYADAVATYLSFLVTQMANHSASICGWNSANAQMRSVFARQAIPMTWDFAEVNLFSESSGSFFSLFDRMIKGFLGLTVIPGSDNFIKNMDAAKNSFLVRPIVISSDPPYYDNIAYADLSDFFFVWLRRTVASIWPDLFRRLTTPKEHELVANAFRHGGKSEAESFFMKGMSEALAAMQQAATQNEPLAIYYAFKQSEAAEEGVTSAGWASFLQAVVGSGLAVDGTWPIDTEKKGRAVGIETNALASSIVLVCRKRAADAPSITRADFIRLLRKEMPDAIDDIRKAGVGPVDMQQSVIGPGMGVFSRHARVLEDDDSSMPVKTALSLINRVWGEIEQELDGAYDAETQVALAWFSSYGAEPRASGELITLANAKNISSDALFTSGVFKDMKGKTALTPRTELPSDWSPATDKSLTVWECVQHTARVLNAEDGGGPAAARLVAEMGAKATEARALAYRLFEIATQKGWSAEALVYNALAQEWPRLEDMATIVTRPMKPVQADMFGAL
jgi:putative DNA methylase